MSSLYHEGMKDSVLFLRGFVLISLLLVSAGSWLFFAVSNNEGDKYLQVSFLDVGQGDAIYVRTPDGYEILIDGGSSNAVLRELSKQKSFFDRDIDVILATHYDTDHIGGLVDVLKQYQVDLIIESGANSDTPASEAFDVTSNMERADRVKAQAGQVFQIGEQVTLKILSPLGDTSNWEANAASAIVQLAYGDIEFMLTGDAPAEIEDYLVGTVGADLESEVLKLGHHGSKTSTSELFLDTVQPEWAVVSAGLNNRYGHPHYSVVDRVFDRDIKLLSTITDGTVTFLSDGQQVWLEE